jgi:hypothetical protein
MYVGLEWGELNLGPLQLYLEALNGPRPESYVEVFEVCLFCLLVYLSVCLSICLSVLRFVFLFVCLSVCLSFYLFSST